MQLKSASGQLLTLMVLASCGGNSGNESPPPDPPVVTEIEIEPASWISEYRGQRLQLTATAIDQYGDPMPGIAFSWASADPAVASVDDIGTVTAVAAREATVVTASAEGVSAMAAIDTQSAVPSHLPVEMYTVWTALSKEGSAVLVDGVLRTVDNALFPGWDLPSPWSHGGVAKYQWYGDRIGVLSDVKNGIGTLRVLDRHREWTLLGIDNVIDFQFEDDRVGLLRSDGLLRVKIGIDGQWTDLKSGIVAFQLEGNFIGALSDHGVLYIKSGVNGEWDVINTGGVVEEFKMAGFIVGALRDDGVFGVYDGAVGSWTELETTGVKQFEITKDRRIAVVRPNGFFRVKDGINSAWTILADDGVEEIALDANRIAALYGDGRFRVKNGIHGLWSNLVDEGLRDFALQEGHVGVVLADGRLRVKQDLNGDWTDSDASITGTDIRQLSLIVDIPVPPIRTHASSFSSGTPSYQDGSKVMSYPDGRSRCLDITANGRGCYQVAEFAVPVAYYGLWCGQGVPDSNHVASGESDLDYARNAKEIDSFDVLCRHHDNKVPYYGAGPDTAGSTTEPVGGVDAGTFDACVVRYGIDYARLTFDGELIGKNHVSWDAIWATMPNLNDVIYNYDWYTSVCVASQLAEFEADTASKHQLYQ